MTETGSFNLFDDAFRRVLASKETGSRRRQRRSLQAPDSDACFCSAATDATDGRGPSSVEFAPELRALVFQSAAIGTHAALLAIPIGIAFAVLLVRVVHERSFGWSIDLHVPWSIALRAWGIGVFSAVLGGLFSVFGFKVLLRVSMCLFICRT